jgi:branched-subunit amino acid aminotransferase/4-amino-4-deoxychorismate lyase
LGSLAAVAARELASVDGRLTPTSEAVLPLPDDGLYRGDGVFEVIRLYAGRPFALEDHLARFGRSAAAIDLPLDRAGFEAELAPLLEAHGDGDAQLRLIATRGGRRILLIEPLAARSESVSIATVTYQPTVILDRVKSLSYGANMHATRLATAAGADEAVLVTPEGIVLEPPTSTVFWAGEDGVLKTPSLDNAILDSITRDRIVAAVPVQEGTFQRADLEGAAEAFLASTTREVQPVSAINGRELDWPGPRTSEAADAFARAIETELATTAGGAA